MKVVIKNGLVWSAGQLGYLDLLIDDQGRIEQLAAPGNLVVNGDARHIDATGMTLLPGMIDIHAHLKDGAETFHGGTCAAARGGVTTVIDMPPPKCVIDENSFTARKKLAERECVTDFGFTGGIITEEEDLGNLSELARLGVAQFKLFMLSRPPVSLIWKSVQAAAASGVRFTVHAEEPACLDAVDWTDPLGFPRANPPVAENVAAAQVMEMARAAGAPLHICHVSSGRTVDLIDAYRGWGTDVTAETTPHYLLLDETSFQKDPGRVLATPALRKAEDRNRLWDGLRDGVLDALISDHYLGALPTPDIKKPPLSSQEPGIPGLEIMMPLMYHAAIIEKRMTLGRFVEVASERPAQLMKIGHKKGSIAVGMDADLVILNTGKTWKLSPEAEGSLIGILPYEGWELGCRVEMTLVRGNTIWDGRQILAEKGTGHYLLESK